jgi:hypothetical protein
VLTKHMARAHGFETFVRGRTIRLDASSLDGHPALGLALRDVREYELRTVAPECRASYTASTARGAMRDGERHRCACARRQHRVSCAHTQEHGTLRQARDCLEIILAVQGDWLDGGSELTGGEHT